jgi:Prokaryotic N-terminal methylation motif
MHRLAAARDRLAVARRDDGITLIELVVGMGVMAIFMGLFTAAIVGLNGIAGHVESVASASGNVNAAFIRLDRMVRYASSISTPTATVNSAGNYYAEFQTTNTGSPVCTQLQLNTTKRQLLLRTWTVTAGGQYANLSPKFSVIANEVAPSGVPFRLNAYGTVAQEQLTISLTSAVGSGSKATTAAQLMTFTAVNSNAASTAVKTNPTLPDGICQEAGRP